MATYKFCWMFASQLRFSELRSKSQRGKQMRLVRFETRQMSTNAYSRVIKEVPGIILATFFETDFIQRSTVLKSGVEIASYA